MGGITVFQVGQRQAGFMGFMQKTFSRSEHHIWFQRSEAKDRLAVVNRYLSLGGGVPLDDDFKIVCR